jgi:hypothetical protein
MGLTIHYNIQAGTEWTRQQIREKLEATRRFALSLPVVSVSEVAEFRGKECQFDRSDEQDSFRWAKIQAGRHVHSPWRPGESRHQGPSHMMCLSIHPAEGSEEMNVGSCSFPRFTWKPEKDHAPGWSVALHPRGGYPKSAKLIRAFMGKYRLKKLPEPKPGTRCRLGESLYWTDGAEVRLRPGPYLSHRRGYGPSTIDLALDDYAARYFCFRFQGAIEEGRTLLTSDEFKADLNDMVHGKEYVVPAEHGLWSSFCKTQYAHSPEVGGWTNFQRAHLSVLAILEHMQQLGFKVHVHDESDFWEHRDLLALAKTIGEWDAAVAGLAGVFKDFAEASGQNFESPMLGRTDFEHLEARAMKIDHMAEHLMKLRAVLLPQAATTA